MAKDNLLDQSNDYGQVIPSTEPEKLYTMIDGKKVEVVTNQTIKESQEPLVHHHNDLDQPGIDITSGITGTSITSPANNDLLAFDSASGLWINQNATNAGVVPEGGTTTGLTLVQPTIGTMTATGGTATNLTLVTPTIGTPALTGGTLTNSVLVTPTVGTPAITGGTAANLTAVTPTIGTMNATGGTATSLTLITPTVGTPAITGGTATNLTCVTPTIGTMTATGGTYNMGTFGTPAIIGGTANNLTLLGTTQIGGTISNLVGFYGSTPVNQPDTVTDPSGGSVIDMEARTAINTIIDRLQELALIA